MFGGFFDSLQAEHSNSRPTSSRGDSIHQWQLESSGFSLPNSPDDAITHPPAWIQVLHESANIVSIPSDEIQEGEASIDGILPENIISAEQEDLSLDEEAITILSSVPSTFASFGEAEQSPRPAQHDDLHNSLMSMETTETRYEDQMSLSIPASSLGISVEDLSVNTPYRTQPLLVSISRDDASLEFCRSISLSNSISSFNQQLVVRDESQPRPWYAYLTSEDDWNRFNNDILEILNAVQGEYDVADNERIIAQLIQQEEYLFWSHEDKEENRRRRQLQRGLMFLLNTVLLTAAPILFSSHFMPSTRLLLHRK